MNALRPMVCHKKIFKDCKIGCAQAEPKYDRRRIISTILVEDHQLMLHTNGNVLAIMICHQKKF